MAWIKPGEAYSQIPRLLLKGEFFFTFDEIPLRCTGLSSRQKKSLLLAGIETKLGLLRRSLPPVIQIEPTNICNLKCSLCPTGTALSTRPKGTMAMCTFDKIVDELGPSLLNVVLYGWGEPFLNPEIFAMIRTLRERNIHSVTSTNGHFLQTLDEAVELVDSGLSGLIIALDGSNQEIYSAYRKSGDVAKVIRCLENLEKAKGIRNSRAPVTNLRVVVTEKNVSDLPNIGRIADRCKVDIFSYKSVGCLVKTREYEQFVPKRKKLRRFADQAPARPFLCPYPLRQPTFFWDGTLVGCEFDYNLEDSLGRIGEQTMKSMWNNQAARNLRRSVLAGRAKTNFCKACPYRDRHNETSILFTKQMRQGKG